MCMQKPKARVAPVSRDILAAADEIGQRAAGKLEELRRPKRVKRPPPTDGESPDRSPTDGSNA